MNPQKKELYDINGILILDKPEHLSSNRALQIVKRLFKAKKAGYAGTLDPFATGMLPICFGKATKLIERLHEHPKCYRATLQLGKATDTGDTEGDIIETSDIPALSDPLLNQAVKNFIGDITQIPPMYSALKHQGQALYKLARQGKTIERAPRAAKVYDLKITRYTPDTITFEVTSAKGLYVRTLAEDLAKNLGTCGHLIALRRLSCAGFKEEDLHTLETLKQANEKDLSTYIKPIDIKY